EAAQVLKTFLENEADLSEFTNKPAEDKAAEDKLGEAKAGKNPKAPTLQATNERTILISVFTKRSDSQTL
ncbi:MAG: hypothetical protein AAFU53_05290, partial [Cyanobacteria bacterium J06632_3]